MKRADLWNVSGAIRLGLIVALIGMVGCATTGGGSSVVDKGRVGQAKAPVITDIRVEDQERTTQVILEAESFGAFSSFLLSDPHRLVVDVADMDLGIFQSDVNIGRGEVTTIHPVQVKVPVPSVRLEIGLNRPLQHGIHLEGNRLVVVLHKPETTLVSESLSEAPVSAPSESVSSTPTMPKDTAQLEKLGTRNSELGTVIPGTVLPPVVHTISVEPEGTMTRVIIRGQGAFSPRVFYVDGKRLVVDLPNTTTTLKARRIPAKSNEALVKRVRLGVHQGRDAKLRVVLDLKEAKVPHEVLVSEGEVALLLGSQAAKTAQASASSQKDAVASLQAGAAIVKPSEGVSETITSEASPTAEPAEAAKPEEEAIEAPQADKDALVARAEPVAEPEAKPAKEKSPTPETSVKPAEPVGATRPVARTPEAEKVKKAEPLAVIAKALQEESGGAAQTAQKQVAGEVTIGGVESRYKGKKISLDFQDADIQNVLRLIAEVSGLNIITSDEVTGKITVKLRNVPWDQALEIILKTKNLGKVQEGNIIRIAPVGTLTKEQEEALRRREAEAKAIPLVTKLVPVNYAKVKTLEPIVKRALSPRGEITIDERTNIIIIKDIPENAEQAVQLVKALDRQTPQVMIEARIVEVNTNYLKELGIQWGGRYIRSPAFANALPYRFPNTFAVGSGVTSGGDEASSRPSSPLVGATGAVGATSNFFGVNLPAAVGIGSGAAIGFSLGSIANSLTLDIQLSALENTGKVRILSTPKVRTLDNKEAIIKSGRKIPYQSVSAAGTQVQWVDAVLELKVTPHITADDHVDLKIVASKNEADFANAVLGTPSIIIKEASSQLLVKDGETIVLGGVFKNTKTEGVRGVPFFAKIPLLGRLFKWENKVDDNEELLIFITPKVVKRVEARQL